MAFSYRSFGRSTSTLTTTVLSTLLATLHCGGGVNEKPSQSSSPAVGTDDAGLSSPGPVSDPSASNGPGSDAITGAELPPTSDEPDPILIDEAPTSDAGVSSECARDSYAAERVGVNLMLLLDISGSMLTPINEAGETQWQAVSRALSNFVRSPSAEGLSIALNYFPAMEERYACQSGETCSDGFPCISQVCDVRLALLGMPVECRSDLDCATFQFDDGSIVTESCIEPFGCEGRPEELCVTDTCQKDVMCEVDGPTVGYCPGSTSCLAADYEQPAVPLVTLPEGQDALLQSIDSIILDYGALTPTHLGLRGATSQVRQWLVNEPDKASILVLATDGLPTSCETGDQTAQQLTVTAVEAAAEADIRTFVIGVVPVAGDNPDLAAEVMAQRAALDGYAVTGGTQSATFVSADDSTAQAFLEALDAIRQTVLPCEYNLPDEDITFDRVNVELTQDGTTQVIPKVEGPADCSSEPGWYYDTETAGGSDADDSEADDAEVDEPTAAVLCVSTCEAINAGMPAQVDIVLGCPTLTPQVR